MRVLVADKFETSGVEGLTAIGCDVIVDADLKDAALTAAIAEKKPDVLIVRGTPVTAPMLEAGPLSLVVRAGAGYNTIDLEAASRLGIYVSNCPGKNAIAVAELVFALILALDRRIADNVAELKAGHWNKKEFSKARGLFGRTIGLLGYGQIGQEVATRAHAFGMRVVVWSRRFAATSAAPGRDAPVEILPSAEAVADAADILSVHLALTPETRHFVNGSLLAHLKSGSFVINTARGEIIDASALEQALREGRIRAGLDVFADEPSSATAAWTTALSSLPNVVGTHHIGGSTDQAQEAIAAETVRIVSAFKTSGRVPNVVNLAAQTPATHTLVVRHRDRPGVLAHVFDRLRSGRINVQETENVIFDGAEAAIARINLDAEPAAELLAAIRGGNEDILDLRLVPIPSAER
jgi:D-3-phosphoglycerate dehydrogenase